LPGFICHYLTYYNKNMETNHQVCKHVYKKYFSVERKESY
jgi:hypothetical protein